MISLPCLRQLARAGRTALLVTTLVLPAIGQAAAEPRQPTRPWKAYPARKAAPRGAPNVLLIMTDDVGFGAASTFGGPVPTPAFDELARSGLRYNQFHTTAMCSPTRAALLTGRNHHAVGSGSISDVSLDEPGYTSVIPSSAATMAQVLKENGYDTSFFGKNHNTPVWENTPVGPFDHWPNGMGFDYFYGFNAPYADQYNPALIENRNTVRPPKEAGYILERDLTDHLIHWLDVRRNLRPDAPFFAYFASGSTHSPHMAPKEWVDRFAGQFDQGWDKVRAETFERQKKLGVIPADAVNTARPDALPAWDSVSPELRKAYARTMEVAAAQLAFFDHQIGRVLDDLRRSGELDNTLVVYIQGDNGASEEDFAGSNNELRLIAGKATTDADLIADIGSHGGPDSFGNYPAAWAWATNAPFQWGKRVASHLGGLRDGMVVSWPNRIKSGGQVCTQFTHVIDVAPTIYEAAGVTPPAMVAGVRQQPIDGTSFLYSFDNPAAPSRHREQYFEMLGNRAFYKDGWMASTIPGRVPWNQAKGPTPEAFEWALYDLRSDFSQSRDVSGQFPAKLAELKKGFDSAARRYGAYPLSADLNNRMEARFRPSLIAGRTNFTYYPGDTRYTNYAFPTISTGWSVSARIRTSGETDNGPVLVQGDHFGGQALILQQGRPTYLYNSGDGTAPVELSTDAPLASGEHVVAVQLQPRSDAKTGATLVMTVDGKPLKSRDIEMVPRGRGDAYIGRRGIAPFSYDPFVPTIADRCSCDIDSVTITQDAPGPRAKISIGE